MTRRHYPAPTTALQVTLDPFAAKPATDLLDEAAKPVRGQVVTGFYGPVSGADLYGTRGDGVVFPLTPDPPPDPGLRYVDATVVSVSSKAKPTMVMVRLPNGTERSGHALVAGVAPAGASVAVLVWAADQVLVLGPLAP